MRPHKKISLFLFFPEHGSYSSIFTRTVNAITMQWLLKICTRRTNKYIENEYWWYTFWRASIWEWDMCKLYRAGGAFVFPRQPFGANANLYTRSLMIEMRPPPSIPDQSTHCMYPLKQYPAPGSVTARITNHKPTARICKNIWRTGTYHIFKL